VFRCEIASGVTDALFNDQRSPLPGNVAPRRGVARWQDYLNALLQDAGVAPVFAAADHAPQAQVLKQHA
jgi:hypothetical protein